jgi:hypothetical protein
MQQRVGAEVLADPAIEGREGVRGREPALEEQAHRVALVAETRLHADEHVAELRAHDEQGAPVGQLLARHGPPLGLDFRQVRLARDVLVRRHGVDVRQRAVLRGVALDNRAAQGLDVVRDVDVVALAAQARKGVVQGLEDRQVGRRAGVAGMRREIEQNDRQATLLARPMPQRHQFFDAGGEDIDALRVGAHGVLALAARRRGLIAAPAVHGRLRGAIELRDGDHHRRLDGHQAVGRVLPLFDALELEGVGGDVGHVQLAEHFFCRRGVVVGRAADQGKPGQGQERIDDRLAVLVDEVLLDRRARVEAARERGDHAQAALTQRGDQPVVMGAVTGEGVGAHDQHAHGADLVLARARQIADTLENRFLARRVVESRLRVLQRCAGAELAAQGLALAGGVVIDEFADHAAQVFVGARQPVLQGQEVDAHVLCRAGNKAQDLRQLAQHRHLLGAGTRLRLAVLAAQALEQRDRSLRFAVHAEAAHARQLHDLRRGHGADHRVAVLAARLQGRQQRLDLVLHEQHGDHDDVAVGDVVEAALEGRRVRAPARRRVHGHMHARCLAPDLRRRALHAVRDVIVQRDQDKAQFAISD